MKKVVSSFFGVLALLAGSAQAADYQAATNICVSIQPAAILTIENNAALSDEVVSMMNDAIEVTDSQQWTDNRNPAWVWSTEAAVACGKAFGYLQNEYRDEQTLNRCECYYKRMIFFMN